MNKEHKGVCKLHVPRIAAECLMLIILINFGSELPHNYGITISA